MTNPETEKPASFHPRRGEKEITNPQELARLLRNGKFVVIAMARDNEPYLVTLSYGYDAQNGRLYLHATRKGQKLDFIAANPAVCATVIEDRGYVAGKCEHAYSSIVLRGTLAVVESLDEQKHGLDVLLNHLEADPEPIKARNIKDDASYAKIAILRLQIESMAGKHN